MTNVRMASENGVTGFRGPSPTIFGDLSKIRADADAGMCMFIDNDFAQPTTLASATAQGGLYSYQDSSCTITGKGINDSGEELGCLVFTTNNTDDDEVTLQFGIGNQWFMANSSGNTSKVMFEARLKVSSVTDNACSIVCGFIEGPVATVHLDDNTGEIKDSLSFVGFRSLYDDGNGLDAVYQDTGASAVQTVEANTHALVADTYVRLGMLFDPYSQDDDKYLTFFVDGDPVCYATKTQVDASTFPELEGMVPVVGVKQYGSAGAAVVLTLDRITVAQYMDCDE